MTSQMISITNSCTRICSEYQRSKLMVENYPADDIEYSHLRKYAAPRYLTCRDLFATSNIASRQSPHKPRLLQAQRTIPKQHQTVTSNRNLPSDSTNRKLRQEQNDSYSHRNRLLSKPWSPKWFLNRRNPQPPASDSKPVPLSIELPNIPYTTLVNLGFERFE